MPPLLSLCITCMNRESQLKQCLKENMIKLSPFTSNELEVVLVHFLHPEKKKENEKIDTWIRRTFPRFIRSGVLRYYVTDRLFSWHASIAKNTSHRLANGSFVVNMDCDNKIDPREVYYLLDLIKGATKKKYRQKMSKNVHGNFIYHGWSGKFHDGTYGRIGMFQEDFKKLGGYDESFLPMGSQDMDLLTRATLFYKSYDKIGPRYNSIAIENTKTDSLENVNFIFMDHINNQDTRKTNTPVNQLINKNTVVEDIDFNSWIPSSLDNKSNSCDNQNNNNSDQGIIYGEGNNINMVVEETQDHSQDHSQDNDSITLEKVHESNANDNYQIESNIDFMLPTGLTTPSVNLPLSKIDDNTPTPNIGVDSGVSSYSNIDIPIEHSGVMVDSQDKWSSVRNILNQTIEQINQLDTLFKNSDLSFQPLPDFQYNYENDGTHNVIGSNTSGSNHSKSREDHLFDLGRGEGSGESEVEGADQGEISEISKNIESIESIESREGKNYPTWVDRPTHIPYTTPSQYESNNLERLKKEIENGGQDGTIQKNSWKRMEGINRRRIYQKVKTDNYIITPPHKGVSVMKILVDHLTMEYSEMVKIVSQYLQSQTKVEPVIYMGET